MPRVRPGETAEMRRLRRRIDALDRRIVELLNERARLGMAMGEAKQEAGKAVIDREREREVLLRVATTNDGPLLQADLVAVYRRVIEATRHLERTARGDRRGGPAREADRLDPEP
ncbi:MAG TPA: chorismate mutase [Candidatus Baltobacteraceae bacterium]|nr:chorismate mutase [Candidatus Baltobacteraceae bacterium]